MLKPFSMGVKSPEELSPGMAVEIQDLAIIDALANSNERPCSAAYLHHN